MKPRKIKRAATESNKDPYFKNLFMGIADGKTLLRFKKSATIFSQGDEADAVFFIESGKIKITVVSSSGKEAVLVMLGPRSSLGEGCLVGQSLRTGTATAVQATTVFRIERRMMLQALHAQRGLSEKFTAALLSRNIHLEENLCDQLFNHSEKRFACVLLKLARFGQQEIRSETKP